MSTLDRYLSAKTPMPKGCHTGSAGTFLFSRAVNGRRRILLWALLAYMAFSCAPTSALASGAMVVGNGLVLSCSQPEPLTLGCDYRLLGNAQPLSASAAIGDVSLPNPTFAVRTGKPANIAVLLLVDTSDPARSRAVSKAREHIAKLVNEAEAHLRFGLASFDSELEILAPIGSDINSIVAATKSLDAKGPTTELYRNVVDALELLSTATDERKVLMVLSDGLAEDRAYFHADAVRKALENHITIYSIGYARSVALSVGLQSLRRLADETGGRFTAANSSFDLPDGFFLGTFTRTENVGALSVDLRTGSKTFRGGTHRLKVVLETNAGPTDATIPVMLPARIAAEPIVKVVEIEIPKIIEVEKVVRVPQRATPSAAVAATRNSSTQRTAEVPLWYWIAAIALLAFALLALLAVLLLRRRSAAIQPLADNTIAVSISTNGAAFLTLDQDVDQQPHPIDSATFRIGRQADNDLVVRDPSVSRHHAEIRRDRDGIFQVLDLDSMNGVFVNGKKVRESDLNEGDDLDVGDVRMRFAAEKVSELAAKDTEILRTVVPERAFPRAAKIASR